MLLVHALLAGLGMSILLSLLILGSLLYNPRLWMQDWPEAMQEAVPPLSQREKRERLLLVPPFFGALIGIPLLVVLLWKQAQGGIGFGEAYLFFFAAWMVFNLVDLIILDWLILVVWQPERLFIPGIAHLSDANTFVFHFRAFLKGTAGILVMSAVAALLVAL